MRASPQRPVHKALCLDRSATGARIRIGTGAPEALSPGTLIAVFAEAGQEVQLGVVRWTLLSADFSAQAGAEERIHDERGPLELAQFQDKFDEREARGGGVCRWSESTCGSTPSNGRRPTIISYATTPKA